MVNFGRFCCLSAGGLGADRGGVRLLSSGSAGCFCCDGRSVCRYTVLNLFEAREYVVSQLVIQGMDIVGVMVNTFLNSGLSGFSAAFFCGDRGFVCLLCTSSAGNFRSEASGVLIDSGFVLGGLRANTGNSCGIGGNLSGVIGNGCFILCGLRTDAGKACGVCRNVGRVVINGFFILGGLRTNACHCCCIGRNIGGVSVNSLFVLGGLNAHTGKASIGVVQVRLVCFGADGGFVRLNVTIQRLITLIAAIGFLLERVILFGLTCIIGGLVNLKLQLLFGGLCQRCDIAFVLACLLASVIGGGLRFICGILCGLGRGDQAVD
ncbi:hypothetical protein D3C75_713830 [compost metagenome]